MNGKVRSNMTLTTQDDDLVDVNLTFQGHYNENIINLKISRQLLRNKGNVLRIKIQGNPYATAPGRMRFSNWEKAEAFLSNMTDKIVDIPY